MPILLGTSDRIYEQASHSGTGPVTLTATAVTGGYQTFLAGWGPSGSGEYTIFGGGNQWETGDGTINAGGTSLTRSPKNGSSGPGTLVNFSAGVKQIIGDVTASVLKSLPAMAGNLNLIGGKLVASVAGGALTVAVKTLAGNDPTAADPVYIVFRDATPANGNPVIRAIVAALSHTINSGNTMALPASLPAKIYVTAHDNAGTVRLGFINCLSTVSTFTPTAIATLDESQLVSSTAGNGGNSAGIFYTATDTITSKPFRVLGRCEFNTGIATPGTWTAPTKVETAYPGMRMPGEVVQFGRTTYTANADLTAQIPDDDTVPDVGEGTQILSITPAINIQPGNFLELSSFGIGVCTVNGINNIVALFWSVQSGAIFATPAFGANVNNNYQGFNFTAYWVPSVSTATYSVRIGPGGSATIRLNGTSLARKLGGALLSTLTFKEICG